MGRVQTFIKKGDTGYSVSLLFIVNGFIGSAWIISSTLQLRALHIFCKTAKSIREVFPLHKLLIADNVIPVCFDNQYCERPFLSNVSCKITCM